MALYFLAGTALAFTGALPLGTVSLSVMYITVNKSTTEAMKLAFTAGIAEVVLAFLAFAYGVHVMHFITEYSWIQIAISFVLLLAGVFLLVRKTKKHSPALKQNAKNLYSGFFLGLFNPPVMVYWLWILGYLTMHNILLQTETSWSLSVLFLTGVYIGKTGALYLYSLGSHYLKEKTEIASHSMNRIMGAVLLAIALFQLLN